MGELRTYLDRGRKLWLQGRPVGPDWMALLRAGSNEVRRNSPAPGPGARPLDRTMWETEGAGVYFPRPVLLDFPLLREWIALEEEEATSYLRLCWGTMRAPEDRPEALEMLSRPSCSTRGEQHWLSFAMESLEDSHGVWAVGVCKDCRRAILQCHGATDDGPVEWELYDSEAAF